MSLKNLIVYNTPLVTSLITDAWQTNDSTMTVHLNNGSDIELVFYLQSGYELDGVTTWSNIEDPSDTASNISITVTSSNNKSVPLDGCNENTYYRLISDGTGGTGNIVVAVDL